MIELQDDRVRLSAIDTRPITKKIDEEQHPLGDERYFSTVRGRNVPLAVGEIVLSFVSRPAWAAIRVSLSPLAAMPSEGCYGLELPASRASACGDSVLFRRHEQMFASGSDDGPPL